MKDSSKTGFVARLQSKRLARLLLSLIISISLSFTACNEQTGSVDIPIPGNQPLYGFSDFSLDQEQYYDKVLGALVGSAIGDAMGASTEMWHRSAIQKEYGYITGLTTALREKSPEGTWDHNMTSGATTDDTRWKYFVGQYFASNRGNLSADRFAAYITEYYQSLVKGLETKGSTTSTDVLDEEIEKINWIKEWARVTMAYQEGGTAYHRAQNRFYGGEMSCAGMLYTPMLGLLESSADGAYINAYEHAIFDLGYARDISGLVAAMTNMAMQRNEMDSILNTHLFVDPFDYKNSRLIGRLASSIAEASGNIIENSKNIPLEDSLKITPPAGFPGSRVDWMQQQYIYQELENQQKAIPFHAGEIWQILITGLEYGDGDFVKTMAFIVNCGRDNDTVAAVAGMVLGARSGYKELPKDLSERVIQVTKEVIGIDLELLAQEIVGQHPG